MGHALSQAEFGKVGGMVARRLGENRLGSSVRLKSIRVRLFCSYIGRLQSDSDDRECSGKPLTVQIVPPAQPLDNDDRFKADYSVDSRSRCRDTHCRLVLAEKELRVGKIPPALKSGHHTRTSWYHPHCIFASFGRTMQSTKTITSTADIEDFAQLRPEDQSLLAQYVERSQETTVADSKFARSQATAPSFARPQATAPSFARPLEAVLLATAPLAAGDEDFYGGPENETVTSFGEEDAEPIDLCSDEQDAEPIALEQEDDDDDDFHIVAAETSSWVPPLPTRSRSSSESLYEPGPYEPPPKRQRHVPLDAAQALVELAVALDAPLRAATPVTPNTTWDYGNPPA